MHAREEPWPPKPDLGETEIEVEAVCSLISSGTELKVGGSGVGVGGWGLGLRGWVSRWLRFGLGSGWRKGEVV